MSKSLVTPKHEVGPLPNGTGGCFARTTNNGLCPGVETANWLNALGDDEDFYIRPTVHCPEGTKNIQVRTNWVREGTHVVFVNETLARARAEERRAAANLRSIRKSIRNLERAEKAAEAGFDTHEEVRGER